MVVCGNASGDAIWQFLFCGERDAEQHKTAPHKGVQEVPEAKTAARLS